MKYKGVSIHKNKNCDTWYTRFRVNGKQYYISARTQKECYNKLKKRLAEGIPQDVIQTYTLIEWYNKWLELYKIGKVKSTTLRQYKCLLIHIPKQVQTQNISTIRLEQLIELINNCKAERQKQNLYELLNALFQKAVDNDIIEKNIVKRIEKPQHEKIHSQALNNAQQREFIDICKSTRYGDLFLVGMYQGLRRGEILALTIDNLDFENNTITINKGWNRNNQFDTTKNK